MTDPRYKRILEIVEAALGVPPDAREALIIREADGDPILLADVRRALDADVPSNFVEPPGGTRSFPPETFEGAHLGDFVLAEEVGRGGMGIVYRAVQKGLQREAAVKVLPAIRRSDPIALQRFEREARSASMLQHDSLVPVLALGIEPDQAWYAMPLVRGHDLQAELSAQDAGDRSNCILPSFGTDEYAMAVVHQIAGLARGLQHAHEQGVVHRDVKPGNIMLEHGGRMLLTDFGLASLAEGRTLTATGALQGTPHYMSPEQAQAVGQQVTHLSDVYSLGVVLFELLTRRKPFQGESAAVILRQITSGTHLRIRKLNTGVPRDLETICEKAMALVPKDRYANAAAMADDLDRFTRNEGIAARPTPTVKRAWRWAKRRPWRVSAALLVGVGGPLVWAALAAERARAERESYAAALRPVVENAEASGDAFTAAYVGLSQPVPKGADAKFLALIDRAQARIDDDIAARIAAVEGALAGASEPRIDPRYGDLLLAPDPTVRTEALLLLQDLLTRYPSQPDVEALEERTRVRIRVDVDPSVANGVPGRAVAQRLDLVTGEFEDTVDLGPLPVETRALRPGTYRITAILEDGRFAELDRDLDLPGTLVALSPRPRATEDFADTMVRIDPVDGRFPGAESRPFNCYIPAEGQDLAPYLVGKYELSVERFIQYLVESGAQPPREWRTLQFDVASGRFAAEGIPADFDDQRWRRLPVTSVTYGELRACAEWYGCRVPTLLELGYAQRGPELLDVPPGLTAPGEPVEPGGFAPNVDGTEVESIRDAVAHFLDVANALQPVDAPSARALPFGLFHTYGNASEWTSTRPLADFKSVLTPLLSDRYHLGGHWVVRRLKRPMSDHGKASAGSKDFQSTIGLRLTRSASPPT